MVVKMQDVLKSIGIKKDLPFTKFLNHELNKLKGSGVLQNILAIPKQNCPMDENRMPITFSKMVFLFTVFVLGGIFSIIIFTFERAVSYKKDGTLEKIDGRAIASRGLRTTMAPTEFEEIEKRSGAGTKIDNPLIVPPELRSILRHWMESNLTQPKEDFLKLLKLEAGAILVNQLLEEQKKKGNCLKKYEKNV